MKYYAQIARVLIALMFVVAGIQKLQNFSGFAGMLGGNLGLPMPTVFAAIVIFIEIAVAAAFAYGYKVKETGYILMAFVALTIVFVHNDMSQLGTALKNLALIGGILAASCCGGRHH
jgi:putative oxidoreductase